MASRDIRAGQQPMHLARLLAAPLTALVQAQAHAELETLNYIVNVGLGGPDRLEAVTLDFGFTHAAPDVARPGELTSRPARVSAPLLSLLQTPSVRIRSAEVTFQVHVTDAQERAAPHPIEYARRLDEEGEPRPVIQPMLRKPVDLIGVFGSALTAEDVPSITVTMRIEAGKENPSYEQVRRVLDDSITAVVTTPDEKPAEPGPEA